MTQNLIPLAQPADTPLTMSSREIADLTGKKLSHVHRDIRAMLGAIAGMDDGSSDGKSLDWKMTKSDMMQLLDHHEIQGVTAEWDARGYTAMFHLNRELTDTLLTGYSIPLRRKVIARWHELEAKAAQPQPTVALPHDYITALEHLLESKKAEQLAIAQRDEAIRTKAQIGSKREASAMATASAAKREAARLKHELGFSARHATILQVEAAIGGDFDFAPLRRWCKANEVTPQTVPDKRYPKGVKAWPAGAWMDCYGVDLVELFGEVLA